jgi:hypothetical protein
MCQVQSFTVLFETKQQKTHRMPAWGVLNKHSVGHRFPLLTCCFQEALV